MKFRYILLAFLSFILLLSCEKESTESEYYDIPVIESYLHPGDTFMVSIFRQTPFSSDVVDSSDDNIDSLYITATTPSGTYVLNPQGGGIYWDTNIEVIGDGSYSIAFNYNNEAVSATTTIPSKPSGFEISKDTIYREKVEVGEFPSFGDEDDMIDLTWSNPDESFYLIVVENIEDDPELIREVEDDDEDDEEGFEFVFRKSPTNDTTDQIRPNEFQYFGTHRVILYHVNEDYASLYEDNSNTSQNLTNPSTSINNGYGIFTGLNSDTLYIEVRED